MSDSNYGTLYVVATPIGNLDDFSKRAIQTLQMVDTILAEDTRQSQILLNHFGIKKPMQSLHMHNEQHILQNLLKKLTHGQDFAIISDAGTPLIRDPGYELVAACHKNNIRVVPIPGACALIAALSASGIPADSFVFGGFLPHQSQAKKNALKTAQNYGLTYVCYESTHRMLDTINIIKQVYSNDYSWCLAKELTKLHEAFINGTSDEILTWLNSDPKHIKGEFVLLLPPQNIIIVEQEQRRVLEVLLKELPVNQAAKLAAKILNVSKNDLYQLALSTKA